MAWGTATADDFLSGVGAKTGGVEFYNRDLELTDLAASWGWEAEASSSSTSWATMSTRTIMVPEWFLSGAEMKLRFRAYLTGTATFSGRITETGTPRSGTTIALTALTTTPTGPDAGVFQVSGLTAPDDTWAGALKTFDLEFIRDTGTGSATMNLEAMALDLQFVGL